MAKNINLYINPGQLFHSGSMAVSKSQMFLLPQSSSSDLPLRIKKMCELLSSLTD